MNKFKIAIHTNHKLIVHICNSVIFKITLFFQLILMSNFDDRV